MSSRTTEVSLAEVWWSDEVREAVHHGHQRIKLPVMPPEFPQRHSMRQVSHGRVPLSGETGYVTMWLFHDTIVSRLSCGSCAHFWADRHTSPTEALHIFGRQSSRHDELMQQFRHIKLALGEGDLVRVMNLRDQVSVDSNVHPLYRANRTAAVTGAVLCRASHDDAITGNLWVVRHGTELGHQLVPKPVIAVYHDRELLKLPSLSSEYPKIIEKRLRGRLGLSEETILGWWDRPLSALDFRSPRQAIAAGDFYAVLDVMAALEDEYFGHFRG